MPETFNCPKCGAPIKVEPSDAVTIECPFCHNSIIVPKELRASLPNPIQEYLDLEQYQKFLPHPVSREDIEREHRRRVQAILIGLSIVGVMLVLVVVAMLPGLTYRFSAQPVEQNVEVIMGVAPVKMPPAVPTSTTAVTPEPSPTPQFAYPLVAFGGKGIGPGLFQDLRYIALDGDGNFYAGEYGPARIQVFNPAGKYITQWIGSSKSILRGLAVSRDGLIYASLEGHILKIDGKTGQELGFLSTAFENNIDYISLAPDGGLVAFVYANRDDITRLDANMQEVFTIRSAFSEQTGDAELDAKVVMDGLGNIYALGEFTQAVFKFSPEGKYLDRFGGRGEGPGSFRSADAIAVDGQGRVYVGNGNHVNVYDASGQFLDMFEITQGVVSGMAFDDQNNLFIAAREYVVKLALREDK